MVKNWPPFTCISYGQGDALARCSANRCAGKERISLLFHLSIFFRHFLLPQRLPFVNNRAISAQLLLFRDPLAPESADPLRSSSNRIVKFSSKFFIGKFFNFFTKLQHSPSGQIKKLSQIVANQEYFKRIDLILRSNFSKK